MQTKFASFVVNMVFLLSCGGKSGRFYFVLQKRNVTLYSYFVAAMADFIGCV